MEDGAFKLRHFSEADVGEHVILRCGERDGSLRASRALHSAIGSGIRTARRCCHGRFVHFYNVQTSREVVEEIHTAGVGGGDGEDRLADVDGAVGVRVPEEQHGGSGGSVFADVLRAILIGVVEDRVANAAAVVVAEVGGEVVRRGRQSHVVQAGAIGTAADEFCSGGHLRIGFIHIHEVVARVEAAKEILSAGVGDSGTEKDVARIDGTIVVHVLIKIDRDVRQRGFTGIDHAVLIGIDPQSVTDGRCDGWRWRRTHAEVGIHILGHIGRQYDRQYRGSGCGVANWNGGQVHGHRPRTAAIGGEPEDAVGAKAVGDVTHGRHTIRGADLHAAQTGFAGILHTIAVEVHENRIANAAGQCRLRRGRIRAGDHLRILDARGSLVVGVGRERCGKALLERGHARCRIEAEERVFLSSSGQIASRDLE